MKLFGIIGIVIVFGVIIVLLNLFFIVDQCQQLLVLQVGCVVEVYNELGVDEVGFKFKILFVQLVVIYDKCNFGFDVLDIEVFVLNQEQLIVDVFVCWWILELLVFYQCFGMQCEVQNQLLCFIDIVICNVLGSQLLEEIIFGQCFELMDEICESLSFVIVGCGIDIIDVCIKCVDLLLDVLQCVFDWMVVMWNQ